MSRRIVVAGARARSRRKTPARMLSAGMALTALVATLGLASPALANLHQEFTPFADCPVNTPGVTTCVLATTDSGEFVLGNKTVPITRTITIQGGLKLDGATCCELVPAVDGNTLSKTPQPVPGGLVGIELLGNFTEVTATAELAEKVHLNPNVVLSGKGIAAALPLKVKLDNPVLGSSCYVGTSQEPLLLQLTTGTTSPPPPNKPISGKGGTPQFSGENQILTITGNSLVDNSMAAPGASGCGLLPLLVDPAVNLQVGIPAAPGHNTAILNGTLREASAPYVAAVLPLPDVGRCQKVEGVAEGKKTVYHGGYTNATCVTESEEHKGKYEWVTGPGPKRKFTGTSKTPLLQTVDGTKISCATGASEGEYTGPKTQSAFFTFTECKTFPHGEPVPCQSSSASAGEIKTAVLVGELEFINETQPAKPIVGLDLKPAAAGAPLATFECGGTPASLGGSVIAPVTVIDKMATSFKMKATALAGKQLPEAFEGGPKDTLTLARAGGSGVQAGLTTTQTIESEEPLEIKGAL
jgi:hypothetical protein